MANSIGSSDAVRRLSLLTNTRGYFIIDNNGTRRRSSNETTANLQARVSHCRRSNTERVLHFCHYYFSNSNTKNTNTSITSNTSSSEDKRVVPTGSNPLHNR
ncbi:hypothetical protein PanWU01x14_344400 [Parasponia andersonii]|uniref:Uncharacterized protein n=1 Tax=Parasponia andersonii TaxID=3476 RepID=A0A2P5AD37_PARAD|nr:hypothetical protein PanWU01x14_344400 [Parasponia andersonii]